MNFAQNMIKSRLLAEDKKVIKMGTNYYARIDTCKECNRADEIHIGKSSVGWRFAVRVHEDRYVDYKSFCEFISSGMKVRLWDEYGKPVIKHEFLEMIKNKEDGQATVSHGASGLVKHDGPVDLCHYDFS